MPRDGSQISFYCSLTVIKRPQWLQKYPKGPEIHNRWLWNHLTIVGYMLFGERSVNFEMRLGEGGLYKLQKIRASGVRMFA